MTILAVRNDVLFRHIKLYWNIEIKFKGQLLSVEKDIAIIIYVAFMW